MICVDFAKFPAQFSTLRNFAQVFAIAKIFAQEINFRQRQNFSVWSKQTTPKVSKYNCFLSLIPAGNKL